MRVKAIVASVLLALQCTTNAADLMISENDWPVDLPTPHKKKFKPKESKKKLPAQYSAEATRKKIHAKKRLGYHTEPLVAAEDRLYALFGVNIFDSEVGSINNNSAGALSGAKLIFNKATNSRPGYELGLGYTWSLWRFDATYFYNKKIHYSPGTLFLNRAETLHSTVRNRGLQGSLYMDFDSYYYFRPYLGLIFGVNWNRTKTILSNGVGNGLEKPYNKFGLSTGFTVGARTRVWDRWYMQMGYRYMFLGNAKWQDKTEQLRLEGKYWFNRINFNIMYIL